MSPNRRGLCFAALLALGCATPPHDGPPPRLAPTSVAERTGDPGGLGSLETRTGAGDTSLLSLQRAQIVARQRGDMAEVEATHTFRNDSDGVLEGTFRFPMPDGALLTGLAMLIDGKLMEGELVEREKARKAYEAVVDGMQDPALLEWEHGSTFKMRVFPIEPHQNKVVTIRYLAPLRQSGDGLQFVQAVRAGVGNVALPELVIDWQGQRVVDEKQVAPERVFSLPAHPASAVQREQRSDGTYAVVRLSPDWQRVAAPTTPPAKNWFIVVDTSRSALEELPRELEALAELLAALPPGSRFRVVTSDLEASAAASGLVQVTPTTIAEARAFVQRVTPDGASDLGRAFELLGGLAQAVPDSAVIYLGDCEPTWGVTRSQDLVALARRELPRSPIYPLLFGASVDDELAAELARSSGGRRARIRRPEDLQAFAQSLPSGVPTLDQLEVKSASYAQVVTSGPLSLEPGRDGWLFVRAPQGKDPLLGLSVNAMVRGKRLDLLPRQPAEDTTGVARRFGDALVRRLERDGKPGPEIVQASLAFGVISKLTSFLVLESEEAYARFAIERRQAATADAPRVTGANLESSNGTDISADRIQPGDPEILIDAERDALSVKVEFPFGETKLASYDPEARNGNGAWMVRFLVALDTPEGDYEALAHILHRDGSLETRKVAYSVDNTAPTLSVSSRPAPHRQEMLEIIVTEQNPGQTSDLKRVELLTPDGHVHQLTPIRWGTFRAFVAKRELGSGVLRVVGFDQAMNHSVKELVLP